MRDSSFHSVDVRLRERHAPTASDRRLVRARRRLATGASVGAVALLTAISLALSPALVANAEPPEVDLGTATAYSVLAYSTITNTGTTTLEGSLGLHPGTEVTGAPGVGGASNIANGASLKAKADLDAAYTNAEGRQPTGVLAAGVGILTLTSGVYKAVSSVDLAGTLTLDGQENPDSFFIFQIPGDLRTAPSMSVELINGAQACNVFWQVGASARLQTDTTFVGTIMAYAQINMLTRATLEGRALARVEQVTFDTNVITVPGCDTDGTVTPPPTSTPPTSTPPTSTPPTSTPPTSTPPTDTPPTSTPPTDTPTGTPTVSPTDTPPTDATTPPFVRPPIRVVVPSATPTAPAFGPPRISVPTSPATVVPPGGNRGGNSPGGPGGSGTLPNTGASMGPIVAGGLSAAALLAVGIGFSIRSRRVRSNG
jgi:LPXTG-motif cell wall-anchored protein